MLLSEQKIFNLYSYQYHYQKFGTYYSSRFFYVAQLNRIKKKVVILLTNNILKILSYPAYCS